MKFLSLLLLSSSLLPSACAKNPVSRDSDFALVCAAGEIGQSRSHHSEINNIYGL